MKAVVLFFIMITFLAIEAKGQNTDAKRKKRHLSESTIVRDSSGIIYPYAVWRKMVLSGDYRVKAIDPGDDSTAYLLIKEDSLHRDRMMDRREKPRESLAFITGDKFKLFTATDIKGNKIDLSQLKGKIVVINYWFVNSQYSQKETSELNTIVQRYAGDPSVVFIAFALDKQREIEAYLFDNPFGYQIIEQSRAYADGNGVHKFPTDVVLDQQGNIAYNSEGYSLRTAYWIDRTIRTLKNKQQ